MYSRYRRFVCNILSSTVRSIRYGLVVAQTERRRRPETNTTQTHPNVVKYTGSFLSASSVVHILHIGCLMDVCKGSTLYQIVRNGLPDQPKCRLRLKCRLVFHMWSRAGVLRIHLECTSFLRHNNLANLSTGIRWFHHTNGELNTMQCIHTYIGQFADALGHQLDTPFNTRPRNKQVAFGETSNGRDRQVE